MNREEYIRIIRENRNLIYKVCLSFCADTEDRKDLEQEIVVKIWNGFRRFDGQAKVSTWVYRVALNTAISYYRKEKRRGHKVSVDREILYLQDTSDADLEYRRNVERHYDLIGELKELDKALILLYLEDLKYSEISNIIGITETNVATKINRIKEKLRRKFSEHPKTE